MRTEAALVPPPGSLVTAPARRSFARVGSLIAVVLFLAAVCAAFTLRPFSPGMAGADLDASWVTVLGELAAKHARWGVDVAFTYGPASPLVTGYFNDQYFSLTLPILLALSVIQAACVACLLALSLRNLGLVFVGAVLYATALVSNVGFVPDPVFFCVALLVFLLDLGSEGAGPIPRAVVLAAAAAVGVLALSKMTYLLAGLSLSVIADARSLSRRRLPLVSATILAAFLATFFIYGQRLGDLANFVRVQGDIIAGYSEAMASVGNRRELALFVTAATALLIAVAATESRSRAPWRAPVAVSLGLAAFLLLTFKAGFVRQDMHTQIAWVSLGLAALVLGLARVLPRSRLGGTVMLGTALAVLLVVGPHFRTAGDPPRRVPLGTLYASWFASVPTELANAAAFLRSPSTFAQDLARRKEEGWAAVRAAVPLPALEGGVDTIPSIQSAVLAAGLDYRPRPSFQEYNTITAALVAANRAFYAGDRAPDWVLFSPDTIDNRYPASAEGALWPELWRGYEPARLFGSYLILHKRAAPLGENLADPTRSSAHLGEAVPVGMDGPVFARIDVQPNMLGRLAGVLFRPPLLDMTVRLRNGQSVSFRFIAEQAREGFLLSPEIEDAEGFAAVAFGQADGLADRDVVDVTIDATPSSRRFLASSIAVELRPVRLGHAPPGPLAAGLYADLERRRAWRRTIIDRGLAKDLSRGRLAAQPPRRVTVPVAGARAVTATFGIEDGAWTSGHTEGVCFAVADEHAPGAALWRRCLDPGGVETDRGEQSARIELPSGTRTLVLDTTCPRSCDWGWSYWSGLAPEPAAAASPAP